MEGDMAIRKTSPYAPRTGGNSSSFEEWILGCPKYAKYGQVACPWKDLAKCSSDVLILGQ